MLAEVFDGILGGLVFDANRENCVDYAERQIVVAVLVCMGQAGKVEFGFAIGDKI